MWEAPKFLIVETAALPQIFSKVAYAKHLLETGETANISLAAKRAGISRSAIYKYRDAVFPYTTEATGKVVSLYLVLRDRPGMLAQVIRTLYQNGGNILTINQNIPLSGSAAVTISIRTDTLSGDVESLLTAARTLPGVLELGVLAAG